MRERREIGEPESSRNRIPAEKGGGVVVDSEVAQSLVVAVDAAAEGAVEVAATRSQEGHMVRVVAGSCM